MPTLFEAGKTAKELGIDTSKTFVVVMSDHFLFDEGELVRLANDNDTTNPLFKSQKTGSSYYCSWEALAYADEPELLHKPLEFMECDTCRAKPGSPVLCVGCLHNRVAIGRLQELCQGDTHKTEPYQPRVGDRVALEGEVVEIEEERRLIVKLQPDAGEIYVYPKQVANGVLKLLSRKTRKLTKEEAERLLSEKLNEQVTIE